VGEALHIAVVAANPNYTFDPEVFGIRGSAPARPQIDPANRTEQPGRHGLAGTGQTGYGIHGTPRPEEVGRTESHGCFRLANWNAEYLLKLVTVGTPVFVEP
jgi:lipoprotein-anchoring transpeptidase ErfK/SrfK